MLNFGNKEFRNIQEQVQKNKDDISGIIEGSKVLSEFGIKVVGAVETVEQLPDPLTYEGDFGDAYSVGTEAPYDFYVLTRPNVDTPVKHWFNLGQFPAVGPQGPQGEQGPAGENGTDGVDGTTLLLRQTVPQANEGKNNDLCIIAPTSDLYEKLNGIWTLVGNIKGIQGVQGPAGPQGEKGVPGAWTVLGTVTSYTLLPDPEIAYAVSPSAAYFVGTEAPYNLYVITGESGSLEWLDIGNVAVQDVKTIVIAESGTEGTLNAAQLADLTADNDFCAARIGDDYYVRQEGRSSSDEVIFKGLNTVLSVDLGTGDWLVEDAPGFNPNAINTFTVNQVLKEQTGAASVGLYWTNNGSNTFIRGNTSGSLQLRAGSGAITMYSNLGIRPGAVNYDMYSFNSTEFLTWKGIRPASNHAQPLGSSTSMWSDLFVDKINGKVAVKDITSEIFSSVPDNTNHTVKATLNAGIVTLEVNLKSTGSTISSGTELATIAEAYRPVLGAAVAQAMTTGYDTTQVYRIYIDGNGKVKSSYNTTTSGTIATIVYHI